MLYKKLIGIWGKEHCAEHATACPYLRETRNLVSSFSTRGLLHVQLHPVLRRWALYLHAPHMMVFAVTIPCRHNLFRPSLQIYLFCLRLQEVLSATSIVMCSVTHITLVTDAKDVDKHLVQ